MWLFWRTCLSAGLLLVLTGCQTPIQTQQLLTEPPAIARQHHIENVPFYPQQEFFCGPTTLSEVAGFYGIQREPAAIAPTSFIPGLQGTLQIEMAAATRQLGLLAYTKNGSLDLLLRLVAENIPVIVLQNNSIAWLPQWHYAVVIGYDLDSAEVILHTGLNPDYRLNLATFERTWARGKFWFLAMLPPDKSSTLLDPFIFTKASQDLLQTQQRQAGVTALRTATITWPDYWLPYFLLGNHYFTSAPLIAAQWFDKGLPFARHEIAYLNNYAVLLSEQGCHEKATRLIAQALQISPQDGNLLDSQKQIQAALHSVSAPLAACPFDMTDNKSVRK